MGLGRLLHWQLIRLQDRHSYLQSETSQHVNLSVIVAATVYANEDTVVLIMQSVSLTCSQD